MPFKDLTLAALLAVLVFSTAEASPVKPPPPQLVITSVTTETGAAPCLLTARGREFGDGALEVRLGDAALPVIDSGDTWTIAEFDCATPAGDYLLELSRGPSRTDVDVLSLTLGAMGPQGPVGPEGPTGPEGPQGERGMSGLEIVTYSTYGLILDGSLVYEYDCPAGKRVVGAGWQRDDELSVPWAGVRMWEWYPADEDTWAFRPDPSGGSAAMVLDISLFCINADE